MDFRSYAPKGVHFLETAGNVVAENLVLVIFLAFLQ